MGHRERRGGELIVQIETVDRRLLAGIEETMAEAEHRSGGWLVCKVGCTQCCLGPFGITQLDAMRLRRGLEELERAEPERAARVRARAAEYVAAIAGEYPGDAMTGELQDEERLPASMDDASCPALDPESGRCDLYEARPVMCRTFGPVTKMGEDAFGACELCYVGASDVEMRKCAVEVDAEGLERELLDVLESTGAKGMTIVAYALSAHGGG